VWYAKLGYQKCPEPFPVKLESVFANGGLIGCMKLYVARIYPIKFLEKKSTLSSVNIYFAMKCLLTLFCSLEK
jgi:hypothetical protein